MRLIIAVNILNIQHVQANQWVYHLGDVSLERRVDTHDKRGGGGEDLDECGRQQWNVDVAVAERVHESGEGTTSLGETSVRTGLEQDLLLGHDGAEQHQHIAYTCTTHCQVTNRISLLFYIKLLNIKRLCICHASEDL